MPSGESAAGAGCRRVHGGWCAISGICGSSARSGQHLYTYPANGIVVIAVLVSLRGPGGLLLVLHGGPGSISTSMVHGPVHTFSSCTIGSHPGFHSPLMPVALTRFSPHVMPLGSSAVTCLVGSLHPLGLVCRQLAHHHRLLAHHRRRLAHCRRRLAHCRRPLAHCRRLVRPTRCH